MYKYDLFILLFYLITACLLTLLSFKATLSHLATALVPPGKTATAVVWPETWSFHDKTNKMTYAPSEDSDQTGHPTSECAE